jgi:hypothetical protein
MRLRSESAVWTALLATAMGLSTARCDSSSRPQKLSPDPVAAAQPPPAAPAAVPSPVAAAPAETAPSTPVKLGAPMHETKLVSLSSIAQKPAQYAKTIVKTEGQVTAVCQAMGCWMEISDKQANAHIRMSGHGFFVPKSAAGRRAVVEGTVLARPDQGECEHEAEQATGKTVKVELDATGIELL